MDTIRVVCGLIFNNEKILLCRRKEGKSLAGFWEFPGGKVETNEDDVEALERELLEELDMTVEVLHHFKTVSYEREAPNIELVALKCIFKFSNFTLVDHDSYAWVSLDELLSWDLAPADIDIAKALSSPKLNSAQP